MRDTNLNPEVRKHMALVGFDKKFQTGRGAYLYTREGEAYLDCASQYGCLPFGYNDPDIKSFIDEFLSDDSLSFAQPFQMDYPERLAGQLLSITEGMQNGHCVFTNSGAESVETALKLARRRTGRRKVVSTRNSFHGKTSGALACTGNSAYREGFHVDNGDVIFVDYNDTDAVRMALADEDVAAVIVEPIQGEGGVIIPDESYLPTLSVLCRERGALLIVDEIQTGLMRTGTPLAHQGCQADIILLAKALGGGMVPLGACLISARAWSEEFGRQHSSTFANNNFTCGIGSRVIEKLMSPDLAAHVQRLGQTLGERLRKLAALYPNAIKQVSGTGFMHAIHLRDWDDGHYFSTILSESGHASSFACSYLLNRHRIVILPTLNNRNVMRIQPPLIAGQAEIDQLMGALEDLCRLLQARRYGDVVGRILQPGPRRATRPPPPADRETRRTNTSGRHLGRFAFFVHPLELRNYKEIFPAIGCDDEVFKSWVERYKQKNVDVAVCHHCAPVINRQGDYVDGILITSALLPEDMLTLNHRQKTRLFSNFVSLAARHHADYLGLGAFTSIVSNAGESFIDTDIPYTTGNGLTAHMTSQSVLDYFEHDYSLMNRLRIAFVGPCGSIGRLCFIELAPYFDQVFLHGNPRNPANRSDCLDLIEELLLLSKKSDDEFWSPAFRHLVRAGLEGDIDSPSRLFHIATHDQRASEMLKAADVVICATSSARSSISRDKFKNGAVIFDVSRPADVSIAGDDENIDYIEAGLCTLNESFTFGANNIMGFPPGINLACLAETIVHTMSGESRDMSLSRTIDPSESARTFQKALDYGFSPHLTKRYASFHAAQKGTG